MIFLCDRWLISTLHSDASELEPISSELSEFSEVDQLHGIGTMMLMALRLPSIVHPLMTISWFVGFWTRTVMLQELPFWRYVNDSDTSRSSGTSVSMVGSNTTGIHSGTGPALTLQVTGIVLPWGITTFCLLSLTVPKSSGVFSFFPTKLMRAVTCFIPRS